MLLSSLYARKSKLSAWLFLGTGYYCFVPIRRYEMFRGVRREEYKMNDDKVMTLVVRQAQHGGAITYGVRR